MKRYAGKINSGLMFVLLQTILYGAFLTLDLTGGSIALSSKIKFSLIIICFCYALFYKKSSSRSIIFCLQAALLFTVISDLFILILDYYFYGVLTFILVQQLHGLRIIIINHETKDRREGGILTLKLFADLLFAFIVRIVIQVVIASVVCLLLYRFEVILDRLLIATVFYFICILTNVITACKAALTNPKHNGNVLFAVGMGLFLLCDINVGLFNLSGYLSLPEDLYGLIYSLSSILMWTFYAPSQVLITLSIGKVGNAG